MTSARSTRRGLLVSILPLCALGCAAFDTSVAVKGEAPVRSMTESPIHAELDPVVPPIVGSESYASEEEPVQPRLAGDERSSFVFRNMPLAVAIHTIAEAAGVNMYLDASLGGTIDAVFPRVRLDDALTAILDQNGLQLVEEPEGIYWVSRNDGSQAATASFDLRSTQAVEVQTLLKELLSESTRVVADPNQNIVVVRGPQSEIDLAQEFIGGVDRLKPQVLIEASIFEVDLTEDFELGISHSFTTPAGEDTIDILSSFATSPDHFSYTFNSPNNLETTIQALSQYVGLDLVSSPRVLTITNTEAIVEIVREVPYVNVTNTTSGTTGGVGSTVVEEVQFKEAGVKMRVTPTIQENGILQVVIEQELSEVVEFFNEIPIIDVRSVNSQFLVADEQTIVLGGLMQNVTTRTDRGVPFLMHIPILGRAFRSDDDLIEKRELLIFLTPRIVDPYEAASLANSYQDHYRSRWAEITEPETTRFE